MFARDKGIKIWFFPFYHRSKNNAVFNFQPCDVARGHNSSITIVFTPDVDASKFQVRARGRYWIFSRDHDLGRQGSHACEYLMHGQCPLLTGQQVTYRAVSLVEKDEFKVNGIIVTYEVLNDEGEHVMLCFKVEINIVD